jgi:PhnB protein
MQINPYVHFKGDCAEALKFYETCLGGTIDGVFHYGGSPGEAMVPAGWHDKVMHATLRVGDQVIMATDAPPDHYQRPAGFSVSISLKDEKEGERIFNELAAGGEIRMPFEKTFWSSGFGMVTDRFGIPWMVNCES